MKLKVKFRNKSDKDIIVFDVPNLRSVDEKLVLAPKEEVEWQVPLGHFYSRFKEITYLNSKVKYKERGDWRKLLGLEGKKWVGEFLNLSDIPVASLNLNPQNTLVGLVCPWGIPVATIIPLTSSYITHKKWTLRSRDQEELDPSGYAMPGQQRLTRVHEWQGEHKRSEKELEGIKKKAEELRLRRQKEILAQRV